MWGHILAAIDLVAVVEHKALRAFDPIQAVVAGMAGMVGGSTGASITAIAMTFEMTRDYATILPIIITTVMAHMTRKAISEDSIYTLKLVRRGHVVPEGLQVCEDELLPRPHSLHPQAPSPPPSPVAGGDARGAEGAGPDDFALPPPRAP